MKRHSRGNGFTIIEVVIVMAVAAIILVAVMLSVRAAQRSSRDHTRKRGAEQLVAAFENYNSQHLNDFSGFTCNQDCRDINDPDSTTGHPVPGTVGVSATQNSGITYVIGAGCGTGTEAGQAVSSSFGDRTYAVLYWSESDKTSHCVSGQGQNTAGSVVVAGGGSLAGSVWSEGGSQYSQCIPSADKCLTYSGGSAITYWAPTQFVYDVSNLSAGTVTLTLYYKNNTTLPSSYSYFNVNIYVNGVKTLSNLHLPVDTDGKAPEPYVKSFKLSEEPTSFSVEWTNDWCCIDAPSGHQDANFILMNATLKQ